ncbi:neurogenic locus notch-like protein 1 [Nephila pilipes]|uniref:Neurogenic locus notch-like protein 1 n=1 Tax=Nephila pilipes TaxID=299642 RepID=A0A8X6QPY4_NEPPI|nr:neurogenic locus notch-like protein 1 [Nephila pilipes]
MCYAGEVGSSICTDRHAICIDDWSTPNGFRCRCKQGQTANEEGYCQDICDFEENQKQCSVLEAECDVSTNGEKTCKCPPFFLPFINGTTCNKPASFSYLLTLPLNSASYKKKEIFDTRSKRSAEKQYIYIDYDAAERDVRTALRSIFPELLYSNVLKCKENGNSLDCKVEMQFTSITEEDLKRLSQPEVCHTNMESSPACLVPPSLLLRRDSIRTTISVKRTDPCDEDIKEDLCGSETFCTSSDDKLSFKCRCEVGFAIRGTQYLFEDGESFIQSCKDIDECAIANPCPENMECHNTLGSYTCTCRPGFRLKDTKNLEASDCVEICNPNPCVHGDCSKIGDHDFECRCAAGYNGMLCDSQDENFKRARTNTIVVGAVLGGALLVVIILSITSISRIKKKKRVLEESDRILYGTEMTERRNGSETLTTLIKENKFSSYEQNEDVEQKAFFPFSSTVIDVMTLRKTEKLDTLLDKSAKGFLRAPLCTTIDQKDSFGERVGQGRRKHVDQLGNVRRGVFFYYPVGTWTHGSPANKGHPHAVASLKCNSDLFEYQLWILDASGTSIQ